MAVEAKLVNWSSTVWMPQETHPSILTTLTTQKANHFRWIKNVSIHVYASLVFINATVQTGRQKEGQTHSWPWNTSWDSSDIFHTLTEPSLPPVVTQRSRLKQSSPVMASWCPKLQPVTKYIEDYRNCLKGSVLNSILSCYSQSLHIRILIHVPHLNWAIVRSTVKIMCSLPEGKTLRKAFYMNHSGTSESHEISSYSWERNFGGPYRHRAFVSCEFIEMFTCFCFPDHDQLVHISSGL